MAEVEYNPLKLTIEEITIQKFNGQDKMSLMAQFVEASIFQSIFEPALKAEILINDQIGLFVNYPFTGEELISIQYKQNNVVETSTADSNILFFIISGVRNISVSDRARSMTYIVSLISPYFLQNTRKYIQHAYNDPIDVMARKIFDEYVLQDTLTTFQPVLSKKFNVQKTSKIRSFVIPNLRPYQALSWLSKLAVSDNPDDYYQFLFYEDLEQFNFVTLQKLIEDAAGTPEKKSLLRDNKYVYRSDTEISSYMPDGDPNEKLRQITHLVNNKRFSSIEKIAGGYFQNELIEISLLQKSFNSRVTELQPTHDTKFSLGQYPLNTPEYIQAVKNTNANYKTEYANRKHYIINNYLDTDSDVGTTQPSYREKFGRVTKRVHALNQIDLSFTIPANMTVKAGDIIWVDIPENHGFNLVYPDIYLSGLYLIAEVKQVIAAGYRAATSVRVHKDGYLNQLLETSEYNTSLPTISSNGKKLLGTV